MSTIFEALEGLFNNAFSNQENSEEARKKKLEEDKKRVEDQKKHEEDKKRVEDQKKFEEDKKRVEDQKKLNERLLADKFQQYKNDVSKYRIDPVLSKTYFCSEKTEEAIKKTIPNLGDICLVPRSSIQDGKCLNYFVIANIGEAEPFGASGAHGDSVGTLDIPNYPEGLEIFNRNVTVRCSWSQLGIYDSAENCSLRSALHSFNDTLAAAGKFPVTTADQATLKLRKSDLSKLAQDLGTVQQLLDLGPNLFYEGTRDERRWAHSPKGVMIRAIKECNFSVLELFLGQFKKDVSKSGHPERYEERMHEILDAARKTAAADSDPGRGNRLLALVRSALPDHIARKGNRKAIEETIENNLERIKQIEMENERLRKDLADCDKDDQDAYKAFLAARALAAGPGSASGPGPVPSYLPSGAHTSTSSPSAMVPASYDAGDRKSGAQRYTTRSGIQHQ